MFYYQPIIVYKWRYYYTLRKIFCKNGTKSRIKQNLPIAQQNIFTTVFTFAFKTIFYYVIATDVLHNYKYNELWTFMKSVIFNYISA